MIQYIVAIDPGPKTSGAVRLKTLTPRCPNAYILLMARLRSDL
jgi:hypothetical protein